MADFVPKTGAVIDQIRRPEPLEKKEREFADWCAERGLIAVFGKCSPLEDDEDFEPFLTYEMGIEDLVDAKIVASFSSIDPMLITGNTPWPEAWGMAEKMLRLQFERTKEEVAAA